MLHSMARQEAKVAPDYQDNKRFPSALARNDPVALV
jgi:hypothetical protein